MMLYFNSDYGVAGHSSLQTPTSHLSASSSVKRGAGPSSKANSSNVFNFGDNRVQEYLSSLSTSSSSDSTTLSPPPKKRKFIPLTECKAKSDSVQQPEFNAGPSSSNDMSAIMACRLSQTEFGQDLEVGSYEQVSDRLPSVSDSVVLENVYQIGVSVEQSVGPLTRSKKRKLESDSSPEIKKVRKGESKTKSRRHRKHHHRSKHHKHRTEKRPDVITID